MPRAFYEFFLVMTSFTNAHSHCTPKLCDTFQHDYMYRIILNHAGNLLYLVSTRFTVTDYDYNTNKRIRLNMCMYSEVWHKTCSGWTLTFKLDGIYAGRTACTGNDKTKEYSRQHNKKNHVRREREGKEEELLQLEDR